jgi:hypothetical protein
MNQKYYYIVGLVIIILIISGYFLLLKKDHPINNPLVLDGIITNTNSQQVPGEITAFEFQSIDGKELILNIEKAKLLSIDNNEITYDKFKVGDVVRVTTNSGDIFLSSNFLKPSEIKIIK